MAREIEDKIYAALGVESPRALAAVPAPTDVVGDGEPAVEAAPAEQAA